jgi:hypothetical protein
MFSRRGAEARWCFRPGCGGGLGPCFDPNFFGKYSGCRFSVDQGDGEVDTTHAILSISQLCASAPLRESSPSPSSAPMGFSDGLQLVPSTLAIHAQWARLRRPSPGSQFPWRPWRLGGSSYGAGPCRMNCPLGFDSVSGMREGWGIQPPRRQGRQGERGTLRWDMT